MDAASTHGINPSQLFRQKSPLMIYTASQSERGKMITILSKEIQSCESDLAAMGMIISYINAYFPAQFEFVKESLSGDFYDPQEVVFPNNPIFDDYEDVEIACSKFLLGTLGLYLLIPFKNITNQNYKQYFTSRSAALCSIVSLDRGKISLPISAPRAKGVKQKLTLVNEYRKLLVNIMMDPRSVRNEALMRVVNYVIKMTQHVGMMDYVVVEEALVNTVSPILFYTDLQSEVSNYCDAMEAVSSVSHPAFFRILGDPGKMWLTERSRFPILAAVATKIMATRYGSNRYITQQGDIPENYLKLLVESHQKFMVYDGTQVPPKLIKYLSPGLSMEQFYAQHSGRLEIRDSARRTDTTTRQPAEGEIVAEN